MTFNFSGIKLASSRGFASQHLLTIGVMIIGLMVSSFAIDLPAYYATQNQLQTAVDSAALAGAASLPVGELEAEEAALEYAAMNMVAGEVLTEGDLAFSSTATSFEVQATKQVPTIMSRLFCGMKGAFAPFDDGTSDFVNGGCGSMTVAAHAKAVPAARDTILVLDTSSSMKSLGYNQPFNDVKEAGNAFVEMVLALDNEAVDRIGVVSFDKYSAEEIQLTSQAESPSFSTVSDTIDDLSLWSSGGWNTNFYTGLKTALDEMESRGRKNAGKTIVFLTDGYPNLPGGDTSINTCINYYNKRYNRSYWRARAKSCTEDYVDNFMTLTTEQIDRAVELEVTIHTIQIGGEYSNSRNALRTLLQDPDWDAASLDEMSSATEGEQYAAETNDGEGITAIYEAIAKNIKMKLSS